MKINHWEDATRYYFMFPQRVGKTVTMEQYFSRYTEEEKQVKQIDFSKPLRTTVAGYPARVVREGMTLVEYETSQGDTQRVAVDETGMVYVKERARALGSHQFQIENKPEEPKDHLCVYRWNYETKGFGIAQMGDSQLTTKAVAEDWVKRNAKYGITITVKVPV